MFIVQRYSPALRFSRVPGLRGAGFGWKGWRIARGWRTARLRTALGGGTSARSSGGSIKLAGLTGRVKDVLQITKLATIFETFDTAEEAATSFNREAGRSHRRRMGELARPDLTWPVGINVKAHAFRRGLPAGNRL